MKAGVEPEEVGVALEDCGVGRVLEDVVVVVVVVVRLEIVLGCSEERTSTW